MKVNRALTSVNLLYNDLGEGAAAVAAAAEQQGNIKTLCGNRADQTAARHTITIKHSILTPLLVLRTASRTFLQKVRATLDLLFTSVGD